jgi:hypothetical protein
MKRFLSTTAFVSVLAMLFLLGPNQSLTAEMNSVAAAHQPIKVLNVRLNSQTNSLEVQIENTSQKPINYSLIHVEIAGADGQQLKVPVIFGQPPGANTGEAEVLKAGAKISLNAGNAVCDRLREQIASGRVPPPKQFQTSINVVIFGDKSAWKGGELYYPDPTKPLQWIAAEELTRKDLLGSQFAKVTYKTESNLQQCYRSTGFNLQFCCDSNFVANSHFSPDPNGHVQPHDAEACCGDGSCCNYTDIASCP